MYGITKQDLKFIQNKHDFQRNYLNDNFFTSSTGQIKTLLDVSFSANHSKRYYNEMINKINTINDIIASSDTEYTPIFITVTLDGYFRDFLKGNFKRFLSKKYTNKELKKLIPNNDRFGFLIEKIENEKKFNIKDLYNILNFQVNRFQKSKSYTKIRKQGFKPHYVRVAEPHKKDGVPHIHMMLYVPSQFKETLLKTFKEYFPAPQNLKPLNKSNDGQINGFQWDIKSAPAYILKYLFKSFLDVEQGNDLDELQAWYIKHRILRCITSHSIAPAWVYRKMFPLDNDWHYLTDIAKTGFCEWSKEDDYICFEDEYKRVLKYEQGVYTLMFKDRILKQFGTKKEGQTKIDTTNEAYKENIKNRVDERIEKVRIAKEKRIDSKLIYTIDGIEYKKINNELKKFTPRPIVANMSNNFLKDYYQELSRKPFDSINQTHFKVVKNQMIVRGLFDNKKMIKNKDDKFELVSTMSLESLNPDYDYGF